jgi:hypothetical protein
MSSLREILEAARRESGSSLGDLTVLAAKRDPYRQDTLAGRRDGRWFADMFRLYVGFASIHLRGFHYRLVARGDVLKPDGKPYINDDANWVWLSEIAAKAARWLGYIAFDRIIDNRNDAPELTTREEFRKPFGYISSGYLDIPDTDDIRVYPELVGFESRQPNALAFFGEKSSLREVLLPLAQRFDADMYLSGGELSDTLIHTMAKRGAGDGRPLVVFTLSDFDPAGYQMAVSIGRKLQALRDLLFPDLAFEVVPVALSAEQAIDLDLPSTPLKDTERRADRWREKFGREQTEIDALQAIRPGALRETIEEAVAPYFDETLEHRVAEARDEWLEHARQAVEEQIGVEIEAIREEAAPLLAGLADIDARVRATAESVDGLPPISLPEAETRIAAMKTVLISSDWDWARATRALIARKSYGEGSDA